MTLSPHIKHLYRLFSNMLSQFAGMLETASRPMWHPLHGKSLTFAHCVLPFKTTFYEQAAIVSCTSCVDR